MTRPQYDVIVEQDVMVSTRDGVNLLVLIDLLSLPRIPSTMIEIINHMLFYQSFQ